MYEIFYINIRNNINNVKQNFEYLHKSDQLKVRNTLREDKKTERLAAGILKRFLLEEVLKLNYPDDLYYDERRKPYLKHSDMKISFSGVSEYVVAVISDFSQIGIDIEKKKKLSDYSVNMFFTETEWNMMKSGQMEFSRLWGQKEAFLKCIGTGWREKPGISICQNKIQYNDKLYVLEDIPFFPKHFACVCIEEPQEQTEIRVNEIVIDGSGLFQIDTKVM